MSLEVGGVAGWILVETGRLDDVLEHATHIAVDIGDGEGSVLHTSDDLFYLSGLPRLHEVVACLYLADGGQTFADANPVGHDDTLEAPVVAEDLCEQVVVTHRELTVHLII